MRNFVSILGTALLIAACGTKGPLTLPPKPPSPTPAPPAGTVPATDASTKAEAGR